MPYQPTTKEINMLQNLEEGWKDVWAKIVAELLDGRLSQAAKHYLYRTAESNNAENHYEDFASHIFIVVQEKISEKCLFSAYDAETYNNVYAWLLNPHNLQLYYSSFASKELGRRTIIDQETGKRKSVQKIPITKTDSSGKIMEDNPFTI